MQIVLRVALPQVMPRLITALRLALGPARLFLIAGEAIAASEVSIICVGTPCDDSGALDLRFVEQGTLDPALDEDGEIEVELEADDCDEIEYSGDAFDLGEAVAQTLGLAIDPYAEGPGADEARKKAGISKEGEQDGPLAAALMALKKD